jgi:hypothetical protein
MLNESTRQTHPAFAATLRQMVDDECRLLAVLAGVSAHVQEFTITARWEWENIIPVSRENMYPPRQPDEKPDEHVGRTWNPLAEAARLRNPQSFDSYIENLFRLGIIEVSHDLHSLLHHPTGPAKYLAALNEWEIALAEFCAKRPAITDTKDHKLKISENSNLKALKLTHWGKRLAKSASAVEFFDVHLDEVVMPIWAI